MDGVVSGDDVPTTGIQLGHALQSFLQQGEDSWERPEDSGPASSQTNPLTRSQLLTGPPLIRSQLLTDFRFCLNIIQDTQQNKAALRAGLPGIVTFIDTIPSYVVEFMMNYHNSADWQTGAAFSFVELLNVVLQIEKGWKAHSHETRIRVKSVGGSAAYERVYIEWLNEHHPGKVVSWKPYESAKACCMYSCIRRIL